MLPVYFYLFFQCVLVGEHACKKEIWASTLYNYQSNKKFLCVSILASIIAAEVIASFGMLGNIIIAEPNAHTAFAG